jgi:hypothetical protein
MPIYWKNRIETHIEMILGPYTGDIWAKKGTLEGFYGSTSKPVQLIGDTMPWALDRIIKDCDGKGDHIKIIANRARSQAPGIGGEYARFLRPEFAPCIALMNSVLVKPRVLRPEEIAEAQEQMVRLHAGSGAGIYIDQDVKDPTRLRLGESGEVRTRGRQGDYYKVLFFGTKTKGNAKIVQDTLLMLLNKRGDCQVVNYPNEKSRVWFDDKVRDPIGEIARLVNSNEFFVTNRGSLFAKTTKIIEESVNVEEGTRRDRGGDTRGEREGVSALRRDEDRVGSEVSGRE